MQTKHISPLRTSIHTGEESRAEKAEGEHNRDGKIALPQQGVSWSCRACGYAKNPSNLPTCGLCHRNPGSDRTGPDPSLSMISYTAQDLQPAREAWQRQHSLLFKRQQALATLIGSEPCLHSPSSKPRCYTAENSVEDKKEEESEKAAVDREPENGDNEGDREEEVKSTPVAEEREEHEEPRSGIEGEEESQA